MSNVGKTPVTIITGCLGAGKTTLGACELVRAMRALVDVLAFVPDDLFSSARAVNHILKAKRGKRIAIIEHEFGEIGVDDGLVLATRDEILEMNNGCVCCTIRQDIVRILGKLRRRKEVFEHVIIETAGSADPAPAAQTFFANDELKEWLYLDAIITVVDSKNLGEHVDEMKARCSENESVKQVAFADRIVLNKTDLVTDAEKDNLVNRIRGINHHATIIESIQSRVDIDDIVGIRAFNLSTNVRMDDAVLVKSAHQRDGTVKSVGFELASALDLDKVNQWLINLLRNKGQDIFRSKGILSLGRSEDRYAFQSMHMMMEMASSADGDLDGWTESEERACRVVFIGRNLDRDELEAGLRACVFNP
tara:strand:+ start:76 stop:1167 length:1092 start_codon:yes stop_codon:yes gene_type:complete